ncbi:alpha/beta hydrolase [Actinocorallia longicatena]|uniref:Alpha/beta hydrolase family protein n=1 Tax=Actinocorallia longicatena TaxID=111803 RepID=A0ABP6QKJ1_9ACTN
MRSMLAVSALGLIATFTAGTASAGPYAAPTGDVRADLDAAITTAERVHDDGRARALTALRGRRLLAFDARGRGRAVEALGDLDTAGRIIVVVPGADNTLDVFDSPKFAGGAARNLYDQARADAPGERIAVVAWMGYDAPRTLSPAVLDDGRAREAAGLLEDFVSGLRAARPAARFSLVCHSYGTVVCAKAAHAVQATDIALAGSPGTTASTVSGLRTSARVWAGRSSGDWMDWIPNVRWLGLGFGQDPTAASFGATVFPAGSNGHSGYFFAGGEALRSLSLISLGRGGEVRPV